MFSPFVRFRNGTLLFAMAVSVWLIGGCAWLSSPLSKTDNACGIFEQRTNWYRAAKASEQKWQVSTALILAFIHQESGFKSNARPPRKNFLGFIPWLRKPSAYGYAQATKSAWEDYKKETGRKFVFRNRFSDATDFIGWYNNKSANVIKLKRDDAYNLYLAYHEGWEGYRDKSYANKKWLTKVARKVQKNFISYRNQLRLCEDKLDQPWYKSLFVLVVYTKGTMA